MPQLASCCWPCIPDVWITVMSVTVMCLSSPKKSCNYFNILRSAGGISWFVVRGSHPITSFIKTGKNSQSLVIRARRVRKKCNVICDVLVTNFFFPFLSHFTGHVSEPFLRKCGESQLALFWGKILVSGTVLITLGFPWQIQTDCFNIYFSFTLFFHLMGNAAHRDVADYMYFSSSGMGAHSVRSTDRKQHAGPQGKECSFICSSGICLLCL